MHLVGVPLKDFGHTLIKNHTNWVAQTHNLWGPYRGLLENAESAGWRELLFS